MRYLHHIKGLASPVTTTESYLHPALIETEYMNLRTIWILNSLTNPNSSQIHYSILERYRKFEFSGFVTWFAKPLTIF